MQWARSLHLPRICTVPRQGFYLAVIDQQLRLCRAGMATEHGLVTDLDSADIRRRIAAGRRQPLARALGLHRRPDISVLDTTCGLGRDSAVLAGLGCRLTAIERHPGLYALLADALRRADAQALAWRHNWRELYHADALPWLTQSGSTRVYDAIYIEPMFDNTRRSARPQRDRQWWVELVGAGTEAGEGL